MKRILFETFALTVTTATNTWSAPPLAEITGTTICVSLQLIGEAVIELGPIGPEIE